jgi:hypothetical protein
MAITSIHVLRCHVVMEIHSRRAEFRRQRLAHRVLDIGDDHRGALGRQAPRAGRADAGRAAGDDGDLVGEVFHR